MKTKSEQYNEYLSYGGTMTIEEWENDSRYDKSDDPTYQEPEEYITEYEIQLINTLAEINKTISICGDYDQHNLLLMARRHITTIIEEIIEIKNEAKNDKI